MHRVATCLLGFLLVGLPAAPACAQKTWVDAERGYSVKPISKWSGVPVPPTERYTVAKWASARNERNFQCRMLVHVFERKQAPKPGEQEQAAAEAIYDNPDSPWGIKRSFASWSRFNRRGLTLGKGKKLKITAPRGVKYTASLHQGIRDSGYTLGGRPLGNYFWMAALITTDTREYAVEMFCGEVSKKKYLPLFRSAAKSFKLIDREAVAKRDPKAETSTPRDQAREVARKNAKVEGWWFAESENYIIVTNVDQRKRSRVVAMRDQLERIRKLYLRDFPPKEEITAISIVRVCKDRSEYLKYGGSGGSAGYWYAAAKELVLYLEGEKAFALSVLNHEAFHQYIYYACGELSPHSWYNEGYGDYYAGARLQGKSAVIKPFKWRRDIIKGHVRRGTYVPLKEFIRYSQRQYYARSDLCYAQGWSLVYFLNKGLPEGHPWGLILPTYFDVLQKTNSRAKAVDTAYADVDIEALERAWKDFIAGGKKPPLPTKGASKKPPHPGVTGKTAKAPDKGTD